MEGEWIVSHKKNTSIGLRIMKKACGWRNYQAGKNLGMKIDTLQKNGEYDYYLYRSGWPIPLGRTAAGSSEKGTQEIPQNSLLPDF
jgi:hypothetical protein